MATPSNCGNNKIIWTSSASITPDDILKIVKDYMAGPQKKYLDYIGDYYDSQNRDIIRRYEDKERKQRTPNWLVPTAYLTTLVDSMAGYMFGNVVYTAKEDAKDYGEMLTDTFKQINEDVKTYETGVRGVKTDTEGNVLSIDPPKINMISVDPRQMIAVYNNNIEPDIIMGIRVLDDPEPEGKWLLDVITAQRWDSYKVNKKEEISANPNGKNDALAWDECPVIEYNTEKLNGQSSFHQVIPYIAALDAFASGNSNEQDKISDAILLLSTEMPKEFAEHPEWLKFVDKMEKGDTVGYAQRQLDPAFREFAMKWLVKEIFKHAHEVDWHDSETGIAGEASAKSLQLRTIDMEMKAKGIEKVWRLGLYKRLRIFKSFFVKNGSLPEDGEVDVTLNRVKILGLEDIAPLIENVTFVSDKTKIEACGLDPKIEEERMDEQKEKGGEDVTNAFGDIPQSSSGNMSKNDMELQDMMSDQRVK
jgi:SPP1 family phage portal protein